MEWLIGSAKRWQMVLIGLIASGTWSAMGADPVPAAEGQAPPSGPTQPAASAPRMMIFVDPQTGAIQPGPAPGTAPLQLPSAALSASDQGLTEVASPVPGGGILVDLQGRFQSPLFAVIDPDGTVRIRHLQGTPAAVEKK